MKLRYRTAANGRTVVDYEHPDTRAFVRDLLWRLGEDGRLPHATEWRDAGLDDLPAEFTYLRECMGFADMYEMAEWAGLQIARRKGNHDWPVVTSVVGEWIDAEREREARMAAEAEQEYGYGLPVCETPRRVMAFDARAKGYVEVEVWEVR